MRQVGLSVFLPQSLERQRRPWAASTPAWDDFAALQALRLCFTVFSPLRRLAQAAALRKDVLRTQTDQALTRARHHCIDIDQLLAGKAVCSAEFQLNVRQCKRLLASVLDAQGSNDLRLGCCKLVDFSRKHCHAFWLQGLLASKYTAGETFSEGPWGHHDFIGQCQNSREKPADGLRQASSCGKHQGSAATSCSAILPLSSSRQEGGHQ